MKLGISIKLDVTKIDKSRIFKGQKGQYLDLTTFIEVDEQDQYGNNGFICQSTTKDEQAAGVKTPILGNAKVFYNASGQSAPQPSNSVGEATHNPSLADDGFDQDIPF